MEQKEFLLVSEVSHSSLVFQSLSLTVGDCGCCQICFSSRARQLVVICVIMHLCCVTLHSAQTAIVPYYYCRSRHPPGARGSCLLSSLEHYSCLGQQETTVGSTFLTVLPEAATRPWYSYLMHIVILSELVQSLKTSDLVHHSHYLERDTDLPIKIRSLLCSHREFKFCFPSGLYAGKIHSLSLHFPI